MDLYTKLSNVIDRAIKHDSSCDYTNLWSVQDHCTCGRYTRARILYDEIMLILKADAAAQQE
jgi:Tfp pilus assembly protein PilF